MATPFDFDKSPTDVQARVVPATVPQLDLIGRLLTERNWQEADNPKFVARVELIAKGMAQTVFPDDVEGGSHLNNWLHDNVEPQLSKQGASKLIDWLMQQPMQDGHVKPTERSAIADPGADVVPEGRYAIATEPGAVNKIAFYQVDRPTEGRWAGYVFVKLMVSDVEKRISWRASETVLAKIAEVGAENASKTYGREARKCGVCGRGLTNDDSRKRGIGPDCAERMGW